MSEHIKKTIEEMQAKLREHEDAVVSTKKLINQLCGYAGLDIMYPDTELHVSGGSALSVRRNSFFGRPLTTCVKEFLEMRKRGGQDAANLDEIFKALQDGGYHLDEISSKSDAEQKRGVAISLGKNSTTFVRLASKDWGLREWYPALKKKRENGKGDSPEGDAAADSVQATTENLPSVSGSPEAEASPGKSGGTEVEMGA
jgi:hypothetical protein